MAPPRSSCLGSLRPGGPPARPAPPCGWSFASARCPRTTAGCRAGRGPPPVRGQRRGRREQLVDEFETAAARFNVGDAVTLQNVSLTYNGLVGTIAGPINSKLSFPVRFEREGLPPKINIKSSNLAAAEEILSDEL